MTLTNKPFKKLYIDRKDELLSKTLYHAHRMTEYLHKLEKIHYEKTDSNPPNTDTNRS